MTIFKIKIREVGSFINWNTVYGVANSIEDAMRDALAGEPQEIELEILSVEAIAECSFAPQAIDLAA